MSQKSVTGSSRWLYFYTWQWQHLLEVGGKHVAIREWNGISEGKDV